MTDKGAVEVHALALGLLPSSPVDVAERGRGGRKKNERVHIQSTYAAETCLEPLVDCRWNSTLHPAEIRYTVLTALAWAWEPARKAGCVFACFVVLQYPPPKFHDPPGIKDALLHRSFPHVLKHAEPHLESLPTLPR